ncbi:MAG: peptidyl-tRNA hydrolase Pth2 [Candidatus Aenigmarchaeota archaeon]|nr:peptidyl-tRNA hydrolase Pth2 [Candidatus Aenigmarchaeota archaeon]MCK4531327.1 peptidyl-tRNA hydrolase Pth2 [Candidatus Aenigmarchaeota archaeon]
MYKQVIVVRKDLKMDKGKIAAQVAHASLEAYKKADTKDVIGWEAEGMKKVVVGVKDIKEFMKIKERVKEANIPYSVIRDAGRTQIRPGTVTAMGIGPAKEEKINRITKNLKLL